MSLPPLPALALLAGGVLATVAAFVTLLVRKLRSENEARAYLAGVRYVLSGDPDAAIAELSRAAQLNSQTLETYFALGQLFRRKGELERAIRLHTNILLRSALDPEVKQRAQLNLALDYRRSGLKSKAAEVFEQLLAAAPEDPEAILHYRRLLEEEGDWGRAIAVWSGWVEREGKGHEVLSHLLAGGARSLLTSDPEAAETAAARATTLGVRCADAQLALAEAILARGQPSRAAAPLREALALEPELAPKYLKALGSALGGPAEVERFLREGRASARAFVPFGLALALHHREQGRVEEALVELRALLDRHPNLWEARRELGAILLAGGRAEELRAEYEEVLSTLGQPAAGFVCGECRQKLPEHLFRCPACEGWGGVLREPS